MADGKEPGDRLRIMFRHGSRDGGLETYQTELRATLTALRDCGHDFHAVRLETPRLPVLGYLTGTCVFSLESFRPVFAPVIAAFLDRQPERRVCVTLGDHVAHVFTAA
jgi:hypothetical protein